MWTLAFLQKLKAVVPLALRAFLGFSFFVIHGLPKLRSAEGVFDFGKSFAAKGMAPEPLLYLAAWAEVLGGLGLLLGLMTRWAALSLTAVMAYAVFMIHWSDGFAMPQGYEVATLYGIACIVLAVVGPGSISLDRLFWGKNAL